MGDGLMGVKSNKNEVVTQVLEYTADNYKRDLSLKKFFISFFVIFQIILLVLFIYFIYENKQKEKIIYNLNEKIFELLRDTSFIDIGNNSSAGNDLNNNINFYREGEK